MFRQLIGTFLAVLLLLLLATGASLGLLLWGAQQPLPVSETHIFTVDKGSNLTRVARHLVDLEILKSRYVLTLYARLTGSEHIQAGEYQILPGDTPVTLLSRMNRGEVIKYQINFPEGLNWSEWLLRLQQDSRLIHTAALYEAFDVAELDLPTAHPEGWFFPDTYTFTASDSDLDILRTAHARMKAVLQEEWQGRQPGLPYNTPYEALIMASIIEKETGIAAERDAIAGVFVRRLQRNMRLQTDPTVIYGLGSRYLGNVTRQHLREDTPYNTYLIKGLPPTPISMPGREAIHAALHPQDGNALFFVAKGDGSHYFSASLEEHLEAVRRFQLNRVPDYRSSPSATNEN